MQSCLLHQLLGTGLNKSLLHILECTRHARGAHSKVAEGGGRDREQERAWAWGSASTEDKVGCLGFHGLTLYGQIKNIRVAI